MKKQTFFIDQLQQNPWYFRISYKKDYAQMIEHAKESGIDSFVPPVIAIIENKNYIVDGHSRIQAAREVGFKEIDCVIADWIFDYRTLRTWSFRLNRHGYSNPLMLSDMISEDLKITGSSEQVAYQYGVEIDYVESLIKISNLDDDTKVIIQKLITIASRKYQFLLEQITHVHISYLSKLSTEKQIEVVNWIFNDVIYGPSNESQISIPSILEIISVIENIQDSKSDKYKKHYKKIEQKNPTTHIPTEIPFKCKCGLSYEIDTKENRVYEYFDVDNMKVKKEYSIKGNSTYTYSSDDYSIQELRKIISKNAKDSKISVIVEQGNPDEDWK